MPSGHYPHRSRPLVERFWPKVDKDGPLWQGTPCWPWTGTLVQGYGDIMQHGKHYYAHRLSYEWLVGPIPADLEIDHLCRNRACCNPAHLELVTHAENIRRGMAVADRTTWQTANQNSRKTHCVHGHPFDAENTIWDSRGCRHCRACRHLWLRARTERLRKGTGPVRGEANNKAKLTADDVRAMRIADASGVSTADLASAYGVDPSNVWLIVTHRTWKHITEPDEALVQIEGRGTGRTFSITQALAA